MVGHRVFGVVSALSRLLWVAAVAAAYVSLAMVAEHGDDTIGSSAHAWMMHGMAAIAVFVAAHLARWTRWILVPVTLVWAGTWTAFAAKLAGHVAPAWMAQELLAPWVPLVALALTVALGPRRLRAGICKGCGYDLRATPDRCPECGAPASG